jgi:hypothetical protein
MIVGAKDFKSLYVKKFLNDFYFFEYQFIKSDEA